MPGPTWQPENGSWGTMMMSLGAMASFTISARYCASSRQSPWEMATIWSAASSAFVLYLSSSAFRELLSASCDRTVLDRGFVAAVKDRPQVDQGTGSCHGVAYPAGLFQKADIIDCEIGAPVRHFRIQDICCFGRVIALDAQFFSPHDLQTAAHAAGLGIDDPDDSAREFLHQLFGCRYGCLIGAADAGSHGNINDIHALFQRRRKAFDELIGIDQTGLDGVLTVLPFLSPS